MSRLAKLAEDIASTGVANVFGIPGSGSSLELINELEKNDVNFHLVHFEAAAAIMAGTIGHLTNCAGVALSIKGPGLANMVPGLAVCYFEGYPLVAIAEAYAPNVPTSRAHKRIDHEKLTAAVVKGRRMLAENGPNFRTLALWAQEEVPAPVLLDVPNTVVAYEDPIPRNNRVPADGKITKLIIKSKRPVIIAGALAVRQLRSKLLSALHIPVFSTVAAKGILDETLPHAAGVFTGVDSELVPEKKILPLADLVIGIGLRPHELLQAKPFHCEAVNISLFDDKDIDDVFALSATADCKDSEDIFKILSTKKWGLDELNSCAQELRQHMLGTTFLPAHAYDFLERHFGYNARIVIDTGNFCTIGEYIWRSKKPSLYLSSGQGRYMGTALPMGIAASLYDANMPTIVVTGDGGIAPFISEIKLAVQYRLPLLFVLMTDGGFGSIRIRARKDALTFNPLTVKNSSWLSVLNGFGINGLRTDNLKELRDFVERWDTKTGPVYLELVFDPDAYEQMVYGIG